MLFVNPVPGHQIKLLYIMGATWHTKCMFDLDTTDASFAKLLNQQGIETYAMDIVGTGPSVKRYVIGNQYQATIDCLSYVIKHYNIDYVMGYSTGCAMVADLTQHHQFKKIVLLDPQSRTQVNRVLVDNDKYIIDKSAVHTALIENNTTVDADTAQDHIAALSHSDQLVTAAWPMLGHYLKRFDDAQYVDRLISKQPTRAFFTKHSLENTRINFEKCGVYWPHISHWALLEPSRKDLANAVVEFLKHE